MTKSKQRHDKQVDMHFRKKSIHILLDKVLIFRLLRQLHGRFWGIGAMVSLAVGLSICFVIRPDMINAQTAFSDFGNDVRTAPYFAGSLFLAAYGLWRWRNYLKHTLRRSRPVTGLIFLTILGLYLAALMPISWKPWPFWLHMFGVVLAGFSMAATVVADNLLSKTKRSQHINRWRVLRLLSFVAIIGGCYITFMSSVLVRRLALALVGELLIFSGYVVWIGMKTYQGEGPRSNLSHILSKVILVD